MSLQNHGSGSWWYVRHGGFQDIPGQLLGPLDQGYCGLLGP